MVAGSVDPWELLMVDEKAMQRVVMTAAKRDPYAVAMTGSV